MPAIVATFALVLVPLVGREQRRRGSRRGLIMWRWVAPPIALLAVSVLVLWMTGHDLAQDLLAVLAFAVGVGSAAVALAGRPDEPD